MQNIQECNCNLFNITCLKKFSSSQLKKTFYSLCAELLASYWLVVISIGIKKGATTIEFMLL